MEIIQKAEFFDIFGSLLFATLAIISHKALKTKKFSERLLEMIFIISIIAFIIDITLVIRAFLI